MTPQTVSPACQDNHCEQCDGRVVVNNEVYACRHDCHREDTAA